MATLQPYPRAFRRASISAPAATWLRCQVRRDPVDDLATARRANARFREEGRLADGSDRGALHEGLVPSPGLGGREGGLWV